MNNIYKLVSIQPAHPGLHIFAYLNLTENSHSMPEDAKHWISEKRKCHQNNKTIHQQPKLYKKKHACQSLIFRKSCKSCLIHHALNNPTLRVTHQFSTLGLVNGFCSMCP